MKEEEELKVSTFEELLASLKDSPTTNRPKFAYHFEEIIFTENSLKLKATTYWRLWEFSSPSESPEGSSNGPPPTVLLNYQDSYGDEYTKNLPFSQDEAIKILIEKFMNKGSTTKHLRTYPFQNLNIENLKIKVERIYLNTTNWLLLYDIKMFLHRIPHKEAIFHAPEYLNCLMDDMIPTFQKITVIFEEDDAARCICDNNNLELEVVHPNLPMKTLYRMIQKWRLNRRELGKSFKMDVKDVDYIKEILDRLVYPRSKGRSSILPGSNSTHCVTVSINRRLELVVYGDFVRNEDQVQWTLNVKIMEAGSTLNQ